MLLALMLVATEGKGEGGEGLRGRFGLKRTFDLLLISAASAVVLSLLLLTTLLVKLTSRGPVLYWSDRVGRNNAVFRMPKFRSMKTGTPALATHLLKDAGTYLTPI